MVAVRGGAWTTAESSSSSLDYSSPVQCSLRPLAGSKVISNKPATNTALDFIILLLITSLKVSLEQHTEGISATNWDSVSQILSLAIVFVDWDLKSSLSWWKGGMHFTKKSLQNTISLDVILMTLIRRRFQARVWSYSVDFKGRSMWGRNAYWLLRLGEDV